MAMKKVGEYPAYQGCYHFVGATKYRKNMFLADTIRQRLNEIIADILMNKEGVELLESTVAYNHIHVLVKTSLSASQIGQILFGATSRRIREEFPELKEMNTSGLWGGKSCHFIKDQEHLDNCMTYIIAHQPDNTKIDSN